ncbi:MAG: FAD-binding oxidoreductase [Candidatus Acidiferrales bacterium]
MTTAARPVPAQLVDIVGDPNVISDFARLADYEIDGMRPSAAALPGTAEEVTELVRLCGAAKLAAVPCGARTKLRIGMPPTRYDLAIDMTRMNRVLAYEPDDLTLGVEAGLTLAELQRVLGERNQFLPVAAPFFSRATIGGTVATNMDGPMRQSYGTARDYVLGMEFVTGEGVKMKSGARVVKSVTGYDLHKLLIGGLGTLGIITRINFKTFPRPRTKCTLLAAFPDADAALEFRSKIARSALAIHSLEILNPLMWKFLADQTTGQQNASQNPDSVETRDGWMGAVSFSGNEEALGRCETDLRRMAEESKAANFNLAEDRERGRLWDRLCEILSILQETSPEVAILRISVVPTQLRELAGKLQEIAGENQVPVALLARGVGVVYCALLPGDSGDFQNPQMAKTCTAILEAVSKLQGHAMIPWCPVALKKEINIWGPPRDDFALMRKVKEVFDPQRILSPGRYVGGL